MIAPYDVPTVTILPSLCTIAPNDVPTVTQVKGGRIFEVKRAMIKGDTIKGDGLPLKESEGSACRHSLAHT